MTDSMQTSLPFARRRHWRCDRGHRNEIRPDAPVAVFYEHCAACPFGDLPYRIERDVRAGHCAPD